jgi:hypothetical protein
MANESEIEYEKKEYLIDYVIENFDNISPITHVNMYKRDYTNYHSGISKDWHFNFNWRNKDTLNIEFSDMSLDINAILYITETET